MRELQQLMAWICRLALFRREASASDYGADAFFSSAGATAAADSTAFHPLDKLFLLNTDRRFVCKNVFQMFCFMELLFGRA